MSRSLRLRVSALKEQSHSVAPRHVFHFGLEDVKINLTMSNPVNALSAWCGKTVELYLDLFPEESDRLNSLRELLKMNLPLDDRRTLPGHVTGSGIIVDLPRGLILLIHHKTLDRWLQPGGHVDAGELPPGAARREILEEVGIRNAKLISPLLNYDLPIDIDSHPIPENAMKGEPGHIHHDFRFLFEVDSTMPLSLATDEVVSAQWMEFDDPRLPGSVIGAIRKAMELQLG